MRIILSVFTLLLMFFVVGCGTNPMCSPFLSDDLPAEEIYDQTIHSVVYIRTSEGYGSGFLIDKDRKLVVTNQHVINSDKWASILFPYRNEKGELQKNLDYYKEKEEEIIRDNYSTIGLVIAQSIQNDLAIVQLASLPLTAHEIEHDFSRNVEDCMGKGDKVHIFGHPGTRLWNWTQGTFLKSQNTCSLKYPVKDRELAKCLILEADGHAGNSGGPVLNDQGILIGIITGGTDETRSIALTTEKIKALLDTAKTKYMPF